MLQVPGEKGFCRVAEVSKTDLHLIEKFQREVLGLSDLETITEDHLVAIKHAGGNVIVARLNEDIDPEILGFAAYTPSVSGNLVSVNKVAFGVNPKYENRNGVEGWLNYSVAVFGDEAVRNLSKGSFSSASSRVGIRGVTPYSLEILCECDYPLIEGFQENIWSYKPLQMRSISQLKSINGSGGHIIGARLKDTGNLIGFCMDTPSIAGGNLGRYSIIAGVDPNYQNMDVGYQLKLFQMELALSSGARFIDWTFDPLQSRNAYFNIEKLGATISNYTPKYYRNAGGGLNNGLDADRVVAVVGLNSERLVSSVNRENKEHNLQEYHKLLKTKEGASFFMYGDLKEKFNYVIPHGDLDFSDTGKIAIEVPYDIGKIAKDVTFIAKDWQTYLRQAFAQVFNTGYIVTGFITTKEGIPRSYYLLTKKN